MSDIVEVVEEISEAGAEIVIGAEPREEYADGGELAEMERKCGDNVGDDSVVNVLDSLLTMWITSTLVVTVHGLILYKRIKVENSGFAELGEKSNFMSNKIPYVHYFSIG